MNYDFTRYLNIRSAINPVISPDGARLAFLSDISGNYQAWSVDLESGAWAGWPCQLSFFADKTWELHGTKAAPHLLALSDVGGNERQQFYLISNFGFETDGSQAHQVRRLTPNCEAIHHFGAWSKDGQRIVYTSNARNKVDFDYYLLEVQSGEHRLIKEAKGLRMIAAWSPDESKLLVVENYGPLQHELYLLDLESGVETHLTSDCKPARYDGFHWGETGLYVISDRTCDLGAFCRLDQMSGELEQVFCSDDLESGGGELEAAKLGRAGELVALVFNDDCYSRLIMLDLNSKEVREVNGLPKGVYGHLCIAPDGNTLAMDVQTPACNPDIWLVDLKTLECSQATHSNRAGIPSTSHRLPRQVSYMSFDGLDIPALFYLPENPAPDGGHPCILYVHGGPASQVRPDFDVRFQYFLNKGYAILATNVRGSTGYGRKFTALDEVELRMDSVTDLKYAVDWLGGQAEIDPGRIAIYGRSYGGFMVLAAMTRYPELFKAGIDVVGISDWVTFLERTSAWRRSNREREYGSLERDREFLVSISPAHKAHKICRPLLVMAGDNDPRVPLSESKQIADKVKKAGGVVEFVHYTDEGHKFSKLANRIDCFNKMADFLARHL
jgi:dipeptidyl aminopeptidase/acylaminoacyl peptidase